MENDRSSQQPGQVGQGQQVQLSQQGQVAQQAQPAQQAQAQAAQQAQPAQPAQQAQAAQPAQPAQQSARSASPQAPASYGQQAYAAPHQAPAYASAAPQQAPASYSQQAPAYGYAAPHQAPAYAYAGAGYQQAPIPQAPPKKKRGWIVLLIVGICLLIFTAFSVYMCTQALDSLSSTTGPSGTKGLTKDTVGIIEIDGTIQYDGSACSPEGLKELLDEASKSEYVKAIVLRVNSGGGTATAGEEMAEYLRQFDKPVVVSSASINASAAYEISAQADYIYVAKSTEIGGIGTVIELTDLSGLFEKLGINMEVIASAESKDSSYGYRALTDEERAYYQKMVNQINDMFVENVVTGRKMEESEVRKLATGLVFTGVTAVENGLADAIGTREDAIAKAAELAGITDYDTTDLYLNNYDISSLSSLLGETHLSADDIVDALKTQQGAKVK